MSFISNNDAYYFKGRLLATRMDLAISFIIKINHQLYH